MADITALSTEELIKQRQQSQVPQQPVADGIEAIPTEQLVAARQKLRGIEQDIDNRVSSLLEIAAKRVPEFQPPQGGITPVGLVGPRPRSSGYEAKQQAIQELKGMGFSDEQIRLSTQTHSMLNRGRVGRTAGGLAFAIAASKLIPGPIDDAAILATLITGTAAGVGGVAGEAAQTGIEEKRLIGKREALRAFAIEAGTEVGGRALVRAGKLVLSPFIKKTVPEAAALVDDFAKVGGSFSPTELDNKFTLRIGEAFSRGSFGAKEIFQEFEKKQGKAVLAFADNIIEAIGEGVARQTPEEIGEAFAGGISRPGGRVFNILDDLFDPLFKQVDELAGNQAKVGTKSLKQFARKHLATDSRLNGQFLSPTGKSKLEKILGLKEALSFSDMRKLRSSFLKDVQKMARDVDQSQGIVKQLAGITDDAIFNPKTTEGLSQEAKNLLRNTNSLYKSSRKGLETTFAPALAKRLLKNPSRVVKELFPNNNPKSIRLLRESLVEPISGKPSREGKALWNQLRQAWVANAVEEATKEGVANPRIYNNLLRKMGRSSFGEMFPEKAIRESVDKIQDLFAIAGKTAPSGAALFSRGAQTLGVVKMWQGAKDGDFVGFSAGAAMAIGPLAFAKLATNPKGVKLLTAGFKMKPGASGLVPTMARMTRLLRDITRKEKRSMLKKELNKSKSLSRFEQQSLLNIR